VKSGIYETRHVSGTYACPLFLTALNRNFEMDTAWMLLRDNAY